MISITFSSHIKTKYCFYIGNGNYRCEIIFVISSITFFFFLLNKNGFFGVDSLTPFHVMTMDNTTYTTQGLNGTIIVGITHLLKRHYSNSLTHVKHLVKRYKDSYNQVTPLQW